jgi:dolichol-phosphate mannosyltransferase
LVGRHLAAPQNTAAGMSAEFTGHRISVVIPARNEAGAIGALLDEIDAVLRPCLSYEVIVVDDGSTDETPAVLAERRMTGLPLRVLRHDPAAGQSAAIHAGVTVATADVICTLDGDGQNPPGDLLRLLRPLLCGPDQSLGLVAGQRTHRNDPPPRRLASWAANGIRRALLKDGTRDTGCGLKAFRRNAFLALPYFDHMHRFLPALFARDGWRVMLVDVGHRPRRAGRSKYGNFQRALVGVVDVFGVAWLIRRRRKVWAVAVAEPQP